MDWITFVSRGTEYARSLVGMIHPDGSGLRHLDPDVPGQVAWQAGPAFSDGERIILHSVEDERTWEHKSFSHLWIYDLKTNDLKEIATKNRPADFMPPAALLPGEERIVVNPIIRGKQCIVTMNLDGTDQQIVTKPEDGYTYGVSVSPDATRFAFHVAEAPNYHIVVSKLDGSERTIVARHPDHLCFGPMWSPDGEWLLYEDCHSPTDPEHFRADLCISRPDGSEARQITHGQSHWFAAAYGTPESRASGSNIACWSPNRPICTYTRLQPDSLTAWRLNPHPEYDDHFNRDYVPEQARGGSQICLLEPFTDRVTPITSNVKNLWDFRTAWSPEGVNIAFCRAPVGQPPELWVMDADGSNRRFLTRGRFDLGADHPSWIRKRSVHCSSEESKS